VAAIRRLADAGWPAERIIENYPGLTRPDVDAALKATAAG